MAPRCLRPARSRPKPPQDGLKTPQDDPKTLRNASKRPPGAAPDLSETSENPENIRFLFISERIVIRDLGSLAPLTHQPGSARIRAGPDGGGKEKITIKMHVHRIVGVLNRFISCEAERA